jgi:hypothetical protein
MDRLAREVEKALHVETIFGWVGLPYKSITSAEKTLDYSQRESMSR